MEWWELEALWFSGQGEVWIIRLVHEFDSVGATYGQTSLLEHVSM